MEARSDAEQKFQIVAVLFVIAVISLSVLFFFNSYSATENNRNAAFASPLGHNFLDNTDLGSSMETVKGASIVINKDMNCTDCMYFPVNKENSLSSKYVPSDLKNIPLNGGGSLSGEALAYLTSMFKDALTKGINMKVASAYRSYANQVDTFNYWVSKEKEKGISDSQAKINANVYSAKEGHSEHQLGTTVDLSCNTCTPFDNSSGNLKVYSFIETEAYKYGFIISYPKGKDQLTGYKYEPWHIRYIGDNLAKELFDKGYLTNSSDYLEKFLEEKQLWK
ncbi:MAG: M15 family metallopeptidase [bacterium]